MFGIIKKSPVAYYTLCVPRYAFMTMFKYLQKNFIYVLIIITALMSFWGALVYRLYALNNFGIVISLILSCITFIILLLYLKSKTPGQLDYDFQPKQKSQPKNIVRFLLLTSYFLLLTSSLLILFKSQTAQALISPWQAVPPYFFLLYGLATAMLIAVILTKDKKDANTKNNLAIKQFGNLTIFLMFLHYFLTFSIALIVYKIGYGFDPFIHQATVSLIAKIGAVTPKPLYYLGQYSLETILHKITALSIIWLDKLLVPLLAALFLPAAIFRFLQKWFKETKTNFLVIITLLILPFSLFIVTTPQNLAYLFLLLTIFLGLTCANAAELTVVYLLAFTALLIHPLAGIPALLFTLAITIYHCDGLKLKKYFYLAVYLAAALALPLAFYFVNRHHVIAQTTYEPAATTATAFFNLPSQENFLLNFIYLYGFNVKIVLGLLILAGLWLAIKFRNKCRLFFLCLGMSASLLPAWFLTRRLPFDFLISYERNNYTDRILETALIFLLPFVIIALYAFLNKIIRQTKAVAIPLLLFLIILITTSLYLSYPRFDRYYNSRGFSVSQNDIEAVDWIENNTDNDYIVLADQQVSAAALREFGFSRYYKSPLSNNKSSELNSEVSGISSSIYFYPIPTSGQLYQYYLDMVYKKPERATMAKAMNFAGVNESYFVLNKYWWAFDKILAEAKLEADSWQALGAGEIYVFQYLKK